MLALSPGFMRNICSRIFFAGCLFFCLAGFALVVSAQSPLPDPTLNPDSSIVVPPDALLQPEPAVSAQPTSDNWDRFWKIEKVSADDEDWTRHFRIGAIVGLNIKASFSTAGTFNISGNNAANGIYDDGYVREDDTGNALGYTSFWGFQNQSQYNAIDHSLTMHSITSYTTGGGGEESGVFPGFEMAYGGNLWKWGRARIGWDLGFGLLPIKITDTSTMSASVEESTYTFNTGGLTWQGWPSPYQGPFNSAGNPTILTNFVFSHSTNNQSIIGSHTLDVMLYTVRLGPTLYWDLSEDLGLMVGAGPAVGIMSGSLNYDETIGTISNKGHVDGTDLVYGGYVNAMLTYHVEKNGDIYVGVQYMPMGSAHISGGGREAQLNLRGQVYITAGINWPF
jgi:hypothetical protein